MGSPLQDGRRLFLGGRLFVGRDPLGPVCTLEPWKDWLPPDLHGFSSWVKESLGGSQ